MSSFKKISKFSRSSEDIDKKIQSLNEEMVKTGAIVKNTIQEKQLIDKINTRLEKVPEDQKTDFIQYVVNTTNNLNEVKSKLLKGLSALELENFNNKRSFGSVDTKLLSICEDIDKTIQKLQEEAIDTFQYKNKKTLSEGLLNEPPNNKNLDPLTPLNQNFVTIDQLNDHYRLFINRIQEQIATVGGGGETRFQYLDDIVGIATNSPAYNGRFLRWNSLTNTAEFIEVNTQIEIKDNGILVGYASTIDFGDNLVVSLGSGIATVTGVGGEIGILYDDINIGTGISFINFKGTGISSVTSNLTDGIVSVVVDLQSNLDGGGPSTNYGGLDTVDGGII